MVGYPVINETLSSRILKPFFWQDKAPKLRILRLYPAFVEVAHQSVEILASYYDSSKIGKVFC